MKSPDNAQDIVAFNSRANTTLNDLQACVDQGLELAALVVAQADGKGNANPERAVSLARGMIAGELPRLASYFLEEAMRAGAPTRGALLRSISGYFNRGA